MRCRKGFWAVVLIAACGEPGGPADSPGQGPVINQFTASPDDEVTVGTTVKVTLSASATNGIARSIVRWAGAAAGADSVDHNAPKQVSRTTVFSVPGNAAVGSDLTITLRIVDVDGQAAMRTLAPMRMVDTQLPEVSGTLIGPAYVAVGENATFYVTGNDQGQVLWLGYRLGQPPVFQDSLLVSGNVVMDTIRQPTRSEWEGALAVTFFARDGGNNLRHYFAGVLHVVDGTRHGVDFIDLQGPIRDLTYDAARNRLYVAQPTLDRVTAVDLFPLSLGPSVAASGASGLDLTPAGDTLVVTLGTTPFLGFVDLAQPSLVIDTFRFDAVEAGLDHIRVMSNGKAIVTAGGDGMLYQGAAWTYDLSSHDATRRTDVGYGGEVGPVTLVARSSDRSRLLLVMDWGCCPLPAFVYDGLTDTFSNTAIGTVARQRPAVSADSTGDRFLIGNELYTGSLFRLTTFNLPDGDPFSVGAIEPSGEHVYLGTPYGYARVSAYTGMVEKVLLSFEPSTLTLVAGGRIVVTTETGLGIVHPQ